MQDLIGTFFLSLSPILNIRIVRTQRDIHLFHQVPFLVYQNDPHWIPHPLQDIEAIFHRQRNPFLENCELRRWILINSEKKVIGRIAACFKNDDPIGRLGFFECISSNQAAHQLMQKAISWLKDKGCTSLDGPVNFGPRDRYWGLITENFEEKPYYGQNYNPAYYQAFFEKQGFTPYFEQYIYVRKVDRPLEAAYEVRAKRILQNPKYSLSPINLRYSKKFAKDFVEIYNAAWANHDGFQSMHIKQGKDLLQQLKPIIDPDIIWFAYFANRPIGFMVMVPDVNLWFKAAKGNFNLWGKLRFLWAKTRQKPERMIGLAFGVVPRYQKKGLEGALFKVLQSKVLEKESYQEVLITWIGSFNPPMIRVIESLGAQRIRTMVTYRKEL